MIDPWAKHSSRGTIGGYQIVRRVSSGGMGELFLAERLGAAGVSVPVAVKVVHPHLAAQPEIVKMFIAEARVSSRIRHPNVVRVEEFGEQDGNYFLAMEFVDGQPLSHILSNLRKSGRRPATAVAVRIAADVCSGLHAAHMCRDDDGELMGIVHRDVSPSNVLVTRHGEVKIIDFGIAKVRNRAASTGNVLKGKVRYMSPEQARGEALDHRSDTYSLGVVLWEMLAGQPMVEGDNDMAQLHQVLSPKYRALTAVVADIAPQLDQLLRSALSESPDARPRSAALLRKQLLTTIPDANRIDATDLAELVDANADDNELLPPAVWPTPVEDNGPDSIQTVADLRSAPSTPVPAPSQPRPWRVRVLAVVALVAIAGAGYYFSRELGDSSADGQKGAKTPAAGALVDAAPPETVTTPTTTIKAAPDASPVVVIDASVADAAEAASLADKTARKKKARSRKKKARKRSKDSTTTTTDDSMATDFDQEEDE